MDLRVYIIGKKIVGAIKRQANNSFRANFSLGGSVTSYQCDKEILDYVNQVVQVFDFGMVGIDFILDEIEDVVGARMLYQCQPDVHLLEQYFAFVSDKLLH